MTTHLYQKYTSLVEEKHSAHVHTRGETVLFVCLFQGLFIFISVTGLLAGGMGMPIPIGFLQRSSIGRSIAAWILRVRIVFMQSPLLFLSVPEKTAHV